MTEKNVTIINRAGIHARPASVLVQAIKDYKCNVYFEKGANRINAKSIMGILTLALSYKSEIKVIAEGEDEQQAMDTIIRLFESKFEEE